MPLYTPKNTSWWNADDNSLSLQQWDPGFWIFDIEYKIGHMFMTAEKS